MLQVFLQVLKERSLAGWATENSAKRFSKDLGDSWKLFVYGEVDKIPEAE